MKRNFCQSKPRHSSGFSIVELVVAAAIILTVGTAAVGVWVQYIHVTQSGAQTSQAALLTEETAEALEIMRDNSWSANIAPLSLNTSYYLRWNGSSYATSTTPVAINTAYAIKLNFAAVSRDGNSNIVTSGGTVDSHSRNVTVTIIQAASSTQALAQTSFVLHDVYQN